MLKPGTNTIAIRLLARYGKSSFTSPAEGLAIVFEDGSTIPLAGDWKSHFGVALDQAPPLPVRYDREQQPTSLFNGMISPLLPMTMTGVIWYQGEDNVMRPTKYRAVLSALIGDWRARFGQGDIPFLIVSLANWGPRQEKPDDSEWAEVREAQAMTAQTLPKCGLAVAIDLGDAKDIHPTNKQEVGRRLALTAEAVAYGQPVEWSGPWYKSMAVNGTSIVLSFNHVGGGLIAGEGGLLSGFAIAGEDQNFVWGEARIEGDTVVVSSAQVANPVAVRYAWGRTPSEIWPTKPVCPPSRSAPTPGRTRIHRGGIEAGLWRENRIFTWCQPAGSCQVLAIAVIDFYARDVMAGAIRPCHDLKGCSKSPPFKRWKRFARKMAEIR